jgi:hypothetical protein
MVQHGGRERGERHTQQRGGDCQRLRREQLRFAAAAVLEAQVAQVQDGRQHLEHACEQTRGRGRCAT